MTPDTNKFFSELTDLFGKDGKFDKEFINLKNSLETLTNILQKRAGKEKVNHIQTKTFIDNLQDFGKGFLQGAFGIKDKDPKENIIKNVDTKKLDQNQILSNMVEVLIDLKDDKTQAKIHSGLVDIKNIAGTIDNRNTKTIKSNTEESKQEDREKLAEAIARRLSEILDTKKENPNPPSPPSNTPAPAPQSTSPPVPTRPMEPVVSRAPIPSTKPTPLASSNMTSYLQKVALIESSGNKNAKAEKSSASGLFQFTEKTWKETVAEMGKNYTLNDRFDPTKSAEVAEYFSNKQKRLLETRVSKNINQTDLYLGHFLGAEGAANFLNNLEKNPNQTAASVVSEESVKNNKNIFYKKDFIPRTLQEVYDVMDTKIKKAETALEKNKWDNKPIPESVTNISNAPNLQPSNTAKTINQLSSLTTENEDNKLESSRNKNSPTVIISNNIITNTDETVISNTVKEKENSFLRYRNH